MNDQLTVGSGFAGIGGFDLGFERAGMRTIWQSEIDPWCQRVLEKHWPGTQRFGDIRTVTADTAIAPDVFCAGFPCQPASLAGLGKAQEDERWLWPECARIVSELRPKYVVLENVPGLLGRGLGDVLGDLAALGYDAEWDCIRASDFGAPHKRERVWIVAYPNGAGLEGHRSSVRDAAQVTDPRGTGRGGHVANAHGELVSGLGRSGEVAGKAGTGQGNSQERQRHGDALSDRGEALAHPKIFRREWAGQARDGRDGSPYRRLGIDTQDWPAEPQVGRVVDGFPGRVAQIRGLGNALVPQIAEWIGTQIVNHENELREAA